MTDTLKAAVQQAHAFAMRDFATVRDFEAARAVLYDTLCAALEEPIQDVSQLVAEISRLRHNNQVLIDSLWKACGDNKDLVNATIDSQGELK